MAYTVIGSMDQFLANIQPTSTQTSDASTSHNALRTYLRDNLIVTTDFLTGSYKRNTMIRQSRDIDLFLVLDGSYYYGTQTWTGYLNQTNGPANLLDYIKRLLKQKYTNTDVSRDGQAVRVEFGHVHIDVVPAFNRPSSGYYIPSTPTNSWITSEPLRHQAAITEVNSSDEVKGRLVPLVKMAKYWNYSHDYGMRGFFLEMLAKDIFTYASAESYAAAVWTFFDRAITWIENGFTVPDPGTGTDLMRTFLSTQSKKDIAVSRFKTARELADRAIGANDDGDNQRAIANWKTLFGQAFPSYG